MDDLRPRPQSLISWAGGGAHEYKFQKATPIAVIKANLWATVGNVGYVQFSNMSKLIILDLLLIDVLTDTHSYIKCHICT